MSAVIRNSLLALLFLATALPAYEARGADGGIQLGAARTVRVSGTVFDAKTGRPLPNAQVSIETAYETRRGDTGPDGTFLVTATSAEGLGNVSVVFSHPDYQQKYFETALNDALRNRLDVTVAGGHARAKAKKLSLDLACGQQAEIEAKGGSARLAGVCDGQLTGAEVEVRGNRIAVLAEGPFVLRVEDGRVEVRDSQNATLDLRIGAAMQPR
jgi:hypothetical protein